MFKKIKSLQVILLLTISSFESFGQNTSTPNILFFFADDWGRIASIYQDERLGEINEVVKTPTFDQIAKDGVLFTNAYYPVPQCTPTRASTATGCYFWRTGRTAFLNQKDGFDGEDAGNQLTGFGRQLLNQGYFVGASGKTFEKRWSKAQAIPGEKGGYRYSLTIYKESDTKARNKKRKELEAGYRLTIQNLLKASDGKPFFFVFGPINTHRPWIQDSGKELWNIDPNDLKGKMPRFLADVAEVRQDIADYLGEIQALDLMLGIFVDELKKAGQFENTVIIATGDNGPPGFTRGKTNLYDFGIAAPLMVSGPIVSNPGRTVTDFVNLMDLGPTFVDIAGGEIPSEMDGKSILPILLSEKEGRTDESRDHVIVGRERHFHDARPGNLSYPSRAVITDNYTYIVNTHASRWPQGDPYKSQQQVDPRMLYDLGFNGLTVFKDLDASPTKAWVMSVRDEESNRKYWDWTFGMRPEEELYANEDTDQLTNLADNPAHLSTKRAIRKKLEKVRKKTKDPRLKDVFDNPPWTSPEPN